MRRILLLASASVLMALAPTEKDLQKATTLTIQGQEALARGELPKAQANFEKALALVPNFPDALLNLGHLQLKEGRFQEALISYGQARDAYPQLGKSIYQLRVRTYDSVQRQIAVLQANISSLRAQATSAKADPTAIERQVAQYQESLRKLQGIQPPTEATALEAPGEVYYHLGNAQFRLNKLPEAIAEWETCARKVPDFPTVKVNLCVAYWKLGRFAEAKTQLQLAEALGYPVNPKMKADLEKAEAAAKAPAAP